MRIAFVVGEFPNLSITFIINQITGLIDRGHEVDIYAARKGDTSQVHPGVETHGLLDRTTYTFRGSNRKLWRPASVMRALWTQPFRNPAGRWRLLKQLPHGQPRLAWTQLCRAMAFFPQRCYDVIHCHFAPNALGAVAAREAGVLRGKLLTTFHGYDVNTFPRRYRPGVYRQLFECGDLYTANSAFTAQQAVSLGCPAEKIVVLPVGVDCDQFPFHPRRLEKGEPVRILTVARLCEVKGIEYGIRAVAGIASSYPTVRYQIVGQGPLMKHLVELTKSLGMADQVEFLGGLRADQLRTCYARAHLFMLPGVIGRDGAQEGQGLVLIEAQAVGLPVIATRVGGIAESVRDGQSGFLVRQRDADALAERLRYLIDHHERWPEMGRKGRAHVEQHFDMAKLTDRLVTLYGQLVSTTDA